MPFLRSLLILLAFLSPALGQDGPRYAASARDAAQALQLHLDEVLKSGGRPDYTTLPVSNLFRRVFDLEALAALPPPKPSDMAWMFDWGDVANRTNQLIILFGLKPGPDLDRAALWRNLTEYEDQYAAALNFMFRFRARQATTTFLFIDQLTPDQRTPIREAGLQKARDGAAEMMAGAVISVAQGMKPTNARMITAAMRDTRDIWATYILPNDRTHIINLVTETPKTVMDDEVQKNLAAVAAALAPK